MPRTFHKYVSTYCQHGLHSECRLHCKICSTKCLCDCGHPQTERTPDEVAWHEGQIQLAMDLLRHNLADSYAPSEGHLRHLAHRVVDATLPENQQCTFLTREESEPHE